VLTLPMTAAGSLEGVVRHFTHLDASRTLVAVLPLLSSPGRLAPFEEDAARFLAATALAELGFDEQAIEELKPLLGGDSGRLGGALAGAARVASARIHARRGEHREVLALARAAPWEDLFREDAEELAYRAGVAAFRLGRYAEVARWVERVSEGSPYSAYGAILAAQADFALGRYGRAAAAISAAAQTARGAAEGDLLRQRAALLAGELYTELGSYDLAVAALARAVLRGPYGVRARRDLLVAQALGRLARGDLEGGQRLVAELRAHFEGLAAEIGASVASDKDVAERARELRRLWPVRSTVYRRRAWAEERLEAALGSGNGRLWSPGGFAGTIVFVKVPAAFGWLWGDGKRPGGEVPGARPPRAARFFFPPDPRTAEILEALALLEEAPARWGDDCSIRAAIAIRRRIAVWRLGETQRPQLEELRELVGRCDEVLPDGGVRRRAEAALGEAIRIQAQRLTEALRRQALELELAIARARLQETTELEGLRRSVSMPAAASGASAARP
jgi:tetratricopeptide (TPR) repeat protein